MYNLFRKGKDIMKKIGERVKEKIRQLKHERWKKKFESYTEFEVIEDNITFIISLNFKSKTRTVVKEEISSFLEDCLKKQEIDILTTLKATGWIYNVRCAAEGENGKKILLFFEEVNP